MTQATAPARTPVSAVMHSGVINCPPQTPMIEVASLMADHGVHCVVVEGLARRRKQTEELVWGIVSDLDLMKAAAAGELDSEVDQVAVTEIVTIDSDQSVERAMQLMSEYEIAHLVVVAPLSGEPVGVVSTLDVAGMLAASAADEGKERQHA